jgi:hypothetical protein
VGDVLVEMGCRVKMPLREGLTCVHIDRGEIDETCLDTWYQGEVVEGCRRTDSRCGHWGGVWGCHEVYRVDWPWSLEQPFPDAPNPYRCVPDGETCTGPGQCCDGHNGGVCEIAPGADAGTCLQ